MKQREKLIHQAIQWLSPETLTRCVMVFTEVRCLNNPGRILVYSLPPRMAVFAAYQQNLGDYNHWEYERLIEASVQRTKNGWVCGNFWAQDNEEV